MSRYSFYKIYLHTTVWENFYENTHSLRFLSGACGRFSVNYGFDHAVGYFLQLWPKDKDAEIYCEKNFDEGMIDIDSLFGGLTGSDLGYFLKTIGANPNHIENCFLDLPF